MAAQWLRTKNQGERDRAHTRSAQPVGKDEFDPRGRVPNMAKRPGPAQEAAKAVLFLASEDSSLSTAPIVRRGGVSAMDL